MSRLPQRRMKSSRPTPWARMTSRISVRTPVVERAMIDPSSVCSTRASMSIWSTIALMSTRSMIFWMSTRSMIFSMSTRSTILSTSTRSTILLDVDLVEDGVDVDGVEDQGHDALGQRLGQLLHPGADRVGAHRALGQCDIPVIFSSRAGAGGTSIGYRRRRRGSRDARRRHRGVSSATTTASLRGWTWAARIWPRPRSSTARLVRLGLPRGAARGGWLLGLRPARQDGRRARARR